MTDSKIREDHAVPAFAVRKTANFPTNVHRGPATDRIFVVSAMRAVLRTSARSGAGSAIHLE